MTSHVLRWSLICLIKHRVCRIALGSLYLHDKECLRVDEYRRLNFKLLEFKSCLCLSYWGSSQLLKIGQSCYLGCRRNVLIVRGPKLVCGEHTGY